MPWYVMRDLSRSNSLRPAYKLLQEEGFEVFTPMTWKVATRKGRKERQYVPAIHDLLFVNSPREELDPVVARVRTLQYRFIKGHGAANPMTVDSEAMERFITATTSDSDPKYYLPSELSASMVGKKVRIVGGPLDGFEGNLLSIRGMRTKRLIVELPGMLTSAVEVTPDIIQFIE